MRFRPALPLSEISCPTCGKSLDELLTRYPLLDDDFTTQQRDMFVVVMHDCHHLCMCGRCYGKDDEVITCPVCLV